MASKRSKSCNKRHESAPRWMWRRFRRRPRRLRRDVSRSSEAMLKVAKKRVDGARASRGEAPAAYVQALAEDIPLKTTPSTWSFVCFHSETSKTRKKDSKKSIASSSLVDNWSCVMLEKQTMHGLTGRIWMSTVVQWMARWVRRPGHPWKDWLVLTHYGTNKYYRNMMKSRISGCLWTTSVSVHDVK